ncbi:MULTISPECIES: hypothetical protein [Chitinophagaceae]
MKRTLFLIATTLFLFSCVKNANFPKEENITKGSKWNIQIGSTPETVYTQLQQLDKDKKLGLVAIVGRKPFRNIDSLKNLLPYYNAFTVQSTIGRIDRALFFLDSNKISSIEAGNALPIESNRWPLDISNQMAIYPKDSLDITYLKLQTILQINSYSNYNFILPDKPLNKPFDPDMGNYKEWGFAFSEKVNNNNVYRNYTANLFFNNSKLSKITISYKEDQAYN